MDHRVSSPDQNYAQHQTFANDKNCTRLHAQPVSRISLSHLCTPKTDEKLQTQTIKLNLTLHNAYVRKRQETIHAYMRRPSLHLKIETM